jgi:hypothetical protein
MKSLIYYRPELRSAILDKLVGDKKEWYASQIVEEDKLRDSVFCTGIVDRLGEKHFGIRTANIDPIPPNEESNVGDLHDLLLTSAEKLCKLNKTIDVFWSGGLDSTATLLCLLQYSGEYQVRVKLSEGSIDEYPQFYTDWVSVLPHEINRDKNIRSMISKNNMTVFANEADTLYSCGAINETDDWDFYEKIRYGWTWRRYRNYEGYTHDMVHLDNCQSLFIDYDVQRWFIDKHCRGELMRERLDQGTPSYLKGKMELRDLIAYYTGDKEYAYKKDKVVSLRHGQADAFHGTKHIWGVCDDGSLVRSSDTIDPEEFLLYE